ncbi:hypothetical protein C8J57DRAFT_1581647 [Mycena rebaudengoi]|nr:hypothetical protein C8J57DRAFT_1581647 [Mycena rebaudengoi]
MSLRLDSLRDTLAELRISIVYRRHPLEELERRRAVVEAELDLYTYPVLTHPPDITDTSSIQLPLDFSGVCHAWRILALSTPALWTSLLLDVDSEHRALKAPGKLETFVEMWFGRARALSRSFHFFGVAGDRALNTIFNKHAPYLREICMYIDSDSFLNLSSGTPFLVLNHLTLGGDLDGTPSDAFLLAPRLESLQMACVPPSALILPWEQLTTFSAEALTVGECLSVVRKAPCLREFTYWGAFETQAEPPVSHPGLVSLKLSGWGSGGIIPLLALPNLEKLQLDYLSALSDDAIPLPFISSSSLHTFRFGHDTPLALPWLRVMEHLTSLEVGNLLWEYKEDFFRALDQLEILTLSNCETHEISQRFLDALISRCGPAAEGLASLKSFYVSDTAGRRAQPLLFH